MSDEITAPFISNAENNHENTVIVGDKDVSSGSRTNSRSLYMTFPWTHLHNDTGRDVKDKSPEARAYRTKMMLRAVYGIRHQSLSNIPEYIDFAYTKIERK